MILVSPRTIPSIALLTSIFIHILALGSLWVSMFATTHIKEAWKPKVIMKAVVLDKYNYESKKRKRLNYTPDSLEERKELINQLQILRAQQKLSALRQQKLFQQNKSLAENLSRQEQQLSTSELKEIKKLGQLRNIGSNVDIDNRIDVIAKQLADFEELYQDLNDESLNISEDDIVVNSYQTYIHQRITQRWSRPPSARRNMQVLIKIDMVPDGSVVAINIVKSSGNSFFDRSAIVAIKKSTPFSKIRNLKSIAFESNFRSFQLLFNPTDLRL